MKRLCGLVLIAGLGLAGCAANDYRPPSDEEVCAGTYGLRVNTPRYADCMASRQARRAHVAADLMSNPNFPVPLPPPPPPLVPDVPVTTECRSFGIVAGCVLH